MIDHSHFGRFLVTPPYARFLERRSQDSIPPTAGARCCSEFMRPECFGECVKEPGQLTNDERAGRIPSHEPETVHRSEVWFARADRHVHIAFDEAERLYRDGRLVDDPALPPPDVLESLKCQRHDCQADRMDARRYRWLRNSRAYIPEEQGITGGDALDELCDAGIDPARHAPTKEGAQ
jgi:hypothetical protein